MEPQRNTELDNFFIDKIRFSAPTPYNAAAKQRFIAYIHNSGQIVINSKGIIWCPVDSDDVRDSVYLWGARAMSRYVNARYTRRLKYVTPTWQNNIQPYSQESAVRCVTDIMASYRSISSWARLNRYQLNINLIYLELGIDFAVLELPTLAQLIRYVSSGRGSASRYLRLYVEPGVVYSYDKQAGEWDAPVDDKMFRELITEGRATLYVGSRNIEFKIYKKHSKTRIELAIRGRTQVSKCLNSPLSADKSRHITKLADHRTIRHLVGCCLDRIAELFCGKIPAGACEAVDRALDTFRVSPIPDDWTKREVRKQELPPLSYGSPAEAAGEAFHIDTGSQRGVILTGYNNMVLTLSSVHSASLLFCVDTRVRAPPQIFPPYISPIQTLSLPAACMFVNLYVLLAYHLTQGLWKLAILSRVHFRTWRSLPLNCTVAEDILILYIPHS